ncbi:MAG: hypothetical protein K5739_05600 [Lachnospiraceae bacterium]|nr:hypothetical protein [Lachnospiraceae bacterium]
MNYTIQQVSKEFGKAHFQVLDANGFPVGEIDIEGKPLTRAAVTVNVADKQIQMLQIFDPAALGDNPYPELTKRPLDTFEISGDIGEGRIFRRSIKVSLLASFSIQTMCLGGAVYDTYKAHFGTDGTKAAVYRGDVRIANMHKDYKVTNDVHSFALETIDENYFADAVIVGIHWYLSGYYIKDYQEVKGSSASIMTTKNKFILDKVK